MRSQAALVDAYPPAGKALVNYRARIAAIIEEALNWGAEPIFLTQPVLWSKDTPEEVEQRLWTGRMRTEGEYLSPPKLRELMDLFNANLINACREHNATVVDLSFMSGNPNLFFDDCHFTADGAKLIAERMLVAIGEPPAVAEAPNE